jgi:hypothetical protein
MGRKANLSIFLKSYENSQKLAYIIRQAKVSQLPINYSILMPSQTIVVMEDLKN